ncbi:MAG TPA: pilus assembly protein TadG-related protein [Terriglobales bacterium]|nr:pilus assembly protein TadG-related protein [Terriglobales bacterium]
MLSRLLQSPRRHERGQTIALVAISLVSLLAMCALAIDVVTLYVARGEAQRAADAAALGAAKVLADAGVTTDPGNTDSIWAAACAAAVNEAQSVAGQNTVAGQNPAAANVNVTFPAFGGSTCTTPSPAFGSNPQVTVKVTVGNLPTFFARIWSNATNSATATATAEAYNPANYSIYPTGAGNVPNAPRCVKPLLLPNCDPGNAGSGSGCAGFGTFISASSGAITRPGNATSPTPGIIGESFTLTSACANAPCNTLNPPAVTGGPPPTNPYNLYYYPLSIPSSGSGLCPNCVPSSPTGFESDLACCNWSPVQCGLNVSLDTADPSPDGSGGPAAQAGQCLIHISTWSAFSANCVPSLDQDCLDTTKTPFVMEAGTNNPLKGNTTGSSLNSGDVISTSDSVVSLPIYDSSGGGAPASPVAVIGFLQVFINDVNDNGQFTVTVLNVTGCGNTPAPPAVLGSGLPVGVRLIQP